MKFISRLNTLYILLAVPALLLLTFFIGAFIDGFISYMITSLFSFVATLVVIIKVLRDDETWIKRIVIVCLCLLVWVLIFGSTIVITGLAAI